jgi:hypothetical protein
MLVKKCDTIVFVQRPIGTLCFSFVSGRSIPWVPVSPAANIKGRESMEPLISMNYLIHRFSLPYSPPSLGYSQKLPTFPHISKFSRRFLWDIHMHCQQIYPAFFLAVWCKPQNGVSGFFIIFYPLKTRAETGFLPIDEGEKPQKIRGFISHKQ